MCESSDPNSHDTDERFDNDALERWADEGGSFLPEPDDLLPNDGGANAKVDPFPTT